MMSRLRIGYGTDVHALGTDTEFILGGTKIESDRGTLGHSDGDVLVHALIDSLLGACGWGDIGDHFPNSERWKNVRSLDMLEVTIQRMESDGITLINSDITVHCETIRLGTYRETIEENCLDLFDGSPQLNVKFTTAEGLGPVGRGEAVRADAVSLVER